jgi:hypothetical protein
MMVLEEEGIIHKFKKEIRLKELILILEEIDDSIVWKINLSINHYNFNHSLLIDMIPFIRYEYYTISSFFYLLLMIENYRFFENDCLEI